MRKENLVEIIDDARRTYNINSQIKSNTLMLRQRLYDYSDAYRLVRRTITVPNVGSPSNKEYNN